MYTMAVYAAYLLPLLLLLLLLLLILLLLLLLVVVVVVVVVVQFEHPLSEMLGTGSVSVSDFGILAYYNETAW
jgi:hypothetical protein